MLEKTPQSILTHLHYRNLHSFPMVQADLLSVTAVLPQASTATSPRGIKRSHSPDQQEESWAGADDDGMCELHRDPLTVPREKEKRDPKKKPTSIRHSPMSSALSHEVNV